MPHFIIFECDSYFTESQNKTNKKNQWVIFVYYVLYYIIFTAIFGEKIL